MLKKLFRKVVSYVKYDLKLNRFRVSKDKDEMERFGRKVFFGTLYVVQSTGKIVIGDQLYAIKN